MDSKDELQKRVNDAGIRMVLVEIDRATTLLAKIAHAPDRKERQTCLKEAKATIALITRIARSTAFSVVEREEIEDCIRELTDRLRPYSAQRGSPAQGAMAGARNGRGVSHP